MPVKLPDGEVVSIQDFRAQRLLRLKVPLTITCSNCQPSAVNGHLCHEQGCSEAWKDAVHTCKWCGSKFDPEEANQEFCDRNCRATFHGVEDDNDDT